jgi:hypothetical protein
MKVTSQEVGKRKLGFAALKDIAEKNGGMCLSKEYLDVKTKYEWICAKGHKFSRSLDSMQSKGSFCTPCSKGEPVIKDLIDFASSRGGQLVSKKYINGSAQYDWRCSKGHKSHRTWFQMKAAKNFCSQCN